MRRWIDRLHRLEDGLLALLLTSMIVLAGTQILYLAWKLGQTVYNVKCK